MTCFFKRETHRLVIVTLSVNGEKNGPTQFESGPFLDFLINRFAANKLCCELKAD
ncbi:hypothetical protein VCRA2114E365_20229 [Vibrio crassostreae]|nr:hypothetical protein VCRA2119O145_110051 [Vibrio crassostreae]CAK1759079.1 hypothetical protein VCRA2111O320_140059 [Vibrio crassostreae]CAK1778386.1 hypothetical protein VCRA2113O324_150059 [Vibrio crassostreae]CAK1845386.1 hypothetical protein VCRA2117O378_10230 [Vibrio crassostreae]CAK1878636.1 hypothetical protein VCRA2113O351_10549 [Vibrio crassostreae]